jgi:hypothetical protein
MTLSDRLKALSPSKTPKLGRPQVLLVVCRIQLSHEKAKSSGMKKKNSVPEVELYLSKYVYVPVTIDTIPYTTS